MNTEFESAEQFLRLAKQHSSNGDFVSSYDVVAEGLLQFPEDIRLKYQAVLSLVRSGALDSAAAQYDHWQLHVIDDEDCLALAGRLAKDRALAAHGTRRRQLFAESAKQYASVYARTGGYFPGVNAATMSMLAGDETNALRLAAEVLVVLDSSSSEPDYYRLATRAELCLINRDLSGCEQALSLAMKYAEGNWDQISSTRKQLLLLSDYLQLDSRLLVSIQPPSVAHFCGHMIKLGSGALFPHGEVERVKVEINQLIDHHHIHFGFGSAASGADLLIAEALLDRGHEVTIVLPFEQQEFCDVSVRPAGDQWVSLFSRVCQEADRLGKLLQITDGGYQGDNELFVYASEYAMGLARLRAEQLGTNIFQMAVFSGEGDPDAAGTAGDIQRWQKCGLTSLKISSRNPESVPIVKAAQSNPAPTKNRQATFAAGERRLRALLFADVKGFTSFTEAQLPDFYRLIFNPIGHILDEMGDQVQYRNTWGDALYAVFTSVDAAAETAAKMQSLLGKLKGRGTAVPNDVALRIGLHYGPVYQGYDAARSANTFYGTEVSKTARIEPVTPPGETYATEAFSAALALQAPDKYQSDYVGQVPAAKDYGVLRMYHIKTLEVMAEVTSFSSDD